MKNLCISCDAENNNGLAGCDRCLKEMRDFIKKTEDDKMCKNCNYRKSSKQGEPLIQEYPW